ncbi:acetyl-CoA carboxylase, biotin carboxyl carrier protein, partial [bacterium]|nr:acetyl-CoA carboxylase, biotin carboxyl carrier protein [bacterium]
EVNSPIVGTYYSAPSPDSPVFVNVGDKVSSGQVLCIVEAMKVMNEIEAEFSGTIKEICIDDAQPIEAEALMFLIDPS